MVKYVIKRLVLVLFTTFIILSLSFILYKSLPIELPMGKPEQVSQFLNEQYILGYVVRFIEPTAGYGDPLGSVNGYQIAGAGPYYIYYVRPIFEQYFVWLSNIFTRFDWGSSATLYPNQDCMMIIMEKLPVTIELNLIATLISVPIGILIGIVAALHKDKPLDHTINIIIMVIIAIPSFITILYLMLIFGYNLQWLPTRWPQDDAPLADKILGYVIPELSLCLGSIAGFARFVRAELCEVMSSDYLLLARTKGLTRRQSIIHHALRNSMVPVVPMIIAQFFSILGGSMILENLYNIRGIGSLYMSAYGMKDWNLLMADTAFYTIIGLAASVLVDLSYGFIDPRIRMGAKK